MLLGYDPLLQLLHPDDAIDASVLALQRGPSGALNVVPAGADHALDRPAPRGEGDGGGAASGGSSARGAVVGGRRGRGAGRLRPVRALPVRGRRARRRAGDRLRGAAQQPRGARGVPEISLSERRRSRGPGARMPWLRCARWEHERDGEGGRHAARIARRPAERAREEGGSRSLERRVQQLESELEARARAEGNRRAARHPGARRELGRARLSWASLAACSGRSTSRGTRRRRTTSVRTERFWETLEPLVEFLYAVWWRVKPRAPSTCPPRSRARGGQSLGRAALRRDDGPARDPPRAPRAAAVPDARAGHVRAAAGAGRRSLAKSGSVRAKPGERRAAAAAGRAGGRLPGGRQGSGQVLPRALQARAVRAGRLRAGGAADGHAHRPLRGGGRRGDPPRLAQGGLGRPAARVCRTSRSRPLSPGSGRWASCPCPPSGRSTSATRSTSRSYGPEDADDPILVNRLAEEVRATIQRMIDGRLARRRSVWLG